MSSTEKAKETKDEEAEKDKSGSLDEVWASWSKWLKRASLLATLFGTLQALLYFIKIGAMPLDGLTGLAGLSAAIAFVSVGALFALSAVWGIPSFLAHVTLATFSGFAREIFSKRANKEAEKLSVVRVIFWSIATLGLPWLALVSTVAPELFLGCDNRWNFAWGAVAVALAILVVMLFEAPTAEHSTTHPKWDAVARCAVLVLAATLYSGISVVALIAFAPLAVLAGGSEVWRFWAALALCLASAVALNIMAIGTAFNARKAGPDKQVVLLGIQGVLATCMIALVMTLLQIWESAQDWVMVRVSVRVPGASLVLNKETCEAFPEDLVRQMPSRAGKAVEGCVLPEVLVKSVVGTWWPIAVPWADGEEYFIKGDSARLFKKPERRRPAAAEICVAPKKP